MDYFKVQFLVCSSVGGGVGEMTWEKYLTVKKQKSKEKKSKVKETQLEEGEEKGEDNMGFETHSSSMTSPQPLQ